MSLSSVVREYHSGKSSVVCRYGPSSLCHQMGSARD
jgi:hypothetical protein